MKIKAIFVILLLTLSIFVPLLATSRVSAVDIPPAANSLPYIVWQTGGQTAANDLQWNPEFLKLVTENPVHSDTRIIIQGRDTYGQNIEAKVDIPAGTPSSSRFVFNDTHTTPPQPVAFAYIDRIFQQNGTESTVVKVLTEPYYTNNTIYGIQTYLGTFHNISNSPSGFQPGQAYPAFPQGWKYLVATGLHDPNHNYHPLATRQDVPVEPANPEMLKIAINWFDTDQDLQIDAGEFPTGGAQNPGRIWLEGLDESGNKIIKDVNFTTGDTVVIVPHTHVWSTLCKVWGDTKEEIYIFTHPLNQVPLFEYFIYIDHLTIHPDAYDILANPQAPKNAGATNITVALRDIDGNLVHAHDNVTLNFYTSAGKIQPSNDVVIPLCNVTARVNLTADTNARTLKVVVDANVPVDSFGGFVRPAMNLMAWTELTFDGINSVLFTGGWPIHMLMNGYNNSAGAEISIPAPFRQWLPPELGGPEPDGIKLDGPLYEVMIPLQVGCNLISSPVYPMFGPEHYVLGKGIPMDLLFGMTSATDTIEAIWWYDAGAKTWFNYIPGVSNTGAFFKDGVGYWIKAEKPCTLELSGVMMENAPFIPAEYRVYHSWNLMGFTSIGPMKTADYLESLATGPSIDGYGSIASAVGPIWTYNAAARTWARDPTMLWPTQGFWMNYKLGGTADLAP